VAAVWGAHSKNSCCLCHMVAFSAGHGEPMALCHFVNVVVHVLCCMRCCSESLQ
jgi:hypothetical protein